MMIAEKGNDGHYSWDWIAYLRLRSIIRLKKAIYGLYLCILSCIQNLGCLIYKVNYFAKKGSRIDVRYNFMPKKKKKMVEERFTTIYQSTRMNTDWRNIT